MTAWAYYNEFDPFAAAWLRELIKDGLIAPGEVDERSIEDVTPNDLRPFRQCHFFAGIGVWSLAARRTGIPDDAPLWSGSCPCQPFSAAGKGAGFDDERHLGPSFHYLIEQFGPAIVVGEQVTGADGDAWFDLVSADLDATAYAFGVAETCACGFGAPHKRSRNYWVAQRLDHTPSTRHQSAWIGEQKQSESGKRVLGMGREHGGVADSERARLEGYAGDGDHGDEPGWVGTQQNRPAAEGVIPDQLADPFGHRRGEGRNANRGDDGHQSDTGGAISDDGVADSERGRRQQQPSVGPASIQSETRGGGLLQFGNDSTSIFGSDRPGPVNGLWRNADWLRCRDKKWRPVEPATFPLADAGTFRNRVGLLRGAGNAINLAQAEGFLRAVVGSIGQWW